MRTPSAFNACKSASLSLALAALTLAPVIAQGDDEDPDPGPFATGPAGGGELHPNVQPSHAVHYQICMFNTPLLGEIRMYAGTNIWQGWTPCSGSLMAVSQARDLFELIGVNFGGDGRTTFALPDLRGRVPVGAAIGSPTYDVEIGDVLGTEAVGLGSRHLPQHQHTTPARITMQPMERAGEPHTNMQPSLGLTYMIRVSATDPAYLGELRLFSGHIAPSGWMLAEGQTLSIPDNAALFARLGTTFGGDGRTFKLPDLKDRAAIGAGNGPGLTARQLGERTGVNEHTISMNQMPAHSHSIVDPVTNVESVTGSAGTGPGTLGNMQSVTGITWAIATVGLDRPGDSLEDPTLGEISAFTSPISLPAGWMTADGSTLQISSYPSLFSKLGTRYGGDGRTTFSIPDLRGRVAVGHGTGPGLSYHALGSSWGTEMKPALTETYLPTHSHTVEYDVEQPVVSIECAQTSPTNANRLDMTVSFTEEVFSFYSGDVSLTGGSLSNFRRDAEKSYTFNVTPSGDGPVTVVIPANVAWDAAYNDNLASQPFTIVIDTTRPTPILSGPASPTQETTLPITIDFGEVVTGFETADLSIGNGALYAAPIDLGNGLYSATVIARGQGQVTVNLPFASVTDQVGLPNHAASLSITVYQPTAFETWAVASGLTPGVNADPGDNPDGDDKTNIEEFAYDCNPLNAFEDSKVYASLEIDVRPTYLTLTLPVRTGATFSSSTNQQVATIDGVQYIIQASYGLQDFTQAPVVTRTTIDTSHLPALSSGYEYRSFRLQKATAQEARGFIRGGVTTISN